MSSLPQFDDSFHFDAEPSDPGTRFQGARGTVPMREIVALVRLGRPHIVVIGALGTLTFGRFLSGELLVGLAVVAALDWFLVNFVNRTVDVTEDRANGVRGLELLERHRPQITRWALASLAVSLVASHLVAPALTPGASPTTCSALRTTSRSSDAA